MQIIPLREKIGNYDAAARRPDVATIIPLREKIGNYDHLADFLLLFEIIPLREKIGNYDRASRAIPGRLIIPLREKIGNYDTQSRTQLCAANYTTTRENWELRLALDLPLRRRYYTTTREIGNYD